MDNQQKSTPEDILFGAGAVIALGVAAAVVIKRLFFADFFVLDHMMPCMLHALTGYFCPGCGGTRSVAALFQGRFLVSLIDYPLTMYAVLMYAAFMVTQLIQRVSKGRIPVGMPWKHWYLWIALAILAAHFAGKNIYFFVTGREPFVF